MERLCSDTGKVSERFGHFLEYREVTGTPPEKLWALWAIRGKHTSPQGAGAPPTREEAELDLGRGRHPPFLLLLFPPPVEGKKGGAESY